MAYTWIPFYRELAPKLLEYTPAQLIDFLTQANVSGLVDQDEQGNPIPLTDLDPFSFLSFLNKFGDARRIEMAVRVKDFFGLQTSAPTDYNGVPTAEARSVWWFGYGPKRKATDLDDLRLFFRQVVTNSVTEEHFDRVLAIYKVGKAKITQGMFYVNPERFLPINGQTIPYLQKLGISPHYENWGQYQALLSAVRAKVSLPFWELSRAAYLESSGLTPVSEPETFFSAKTSMTQPLNQILYGPPGTGKTYATIEKACEIVGFTNPDGLSDTALRRAQKQFFDEKLRDGRIRFVTVHQALTYEDFVEGIKPYLQKTGEETTVSYQVEDGIFKQMAHEAAGFRQAEEQRRPDSPLHFTKAQFESANFFKMSLGNSDLQEDNISYEYCIQQGCIVLDWGRKVDFSIAQNEAAISELVAKSKIPESYKPYTITAVQRLKFGIKEGDVVFVAKGNQHLRAVGIVRGPYEYRPDSETGYAQFRRVDWLATDLNYPVSQVLKGKLFPKRAIEKLKKTDILPGLFRTQTAVLHPENSNFVLILDEINRGNVAQLFGELITLLEDDKRAGRPEALSVTLPYSKTAFSVPDNLFLIGTMNTADRSVEALDTALRRRFDFTELPPDYTKLARKVAGISLDLLLQTINRRLETLLDRDHLIGHAYFMPVETDEDLCRVFDRRLVPLLQEYFFNDYRKIGLVLGRGFVTEERAEPVRFAAFDEDLASEYADRPRYRLNPTTVDAIRQILSR